MIAFAVVMLLASCTQPETSDLLAPAPQSTDIPGSRAINDIFKLERMGDFFVSDIGRVDFQGNIYCPRGNMYYDLSKKQSFDFPFNKIYSSLPDWFWFCNDWCFDSKGNILVIGHGHIYMFTPDMNSVVDLTPYFPSGIDFYNICAAENGNIFVSTGDELTESSYYPGYYYFAKQKIYRLNANTGVVKEVLSGIEISSDLMKMKGAFIGGYCNGVLFKANTNTGEVEYIAPRVNGIYAAASDMPNFYVIDGIKIVEIRPNVATDLVIGTIPTSYIDKNGDIVFPDIGSYDMGFRVNANATVFYAGSFKLTLQ